jgi:hypothetical protein
MIVNAAANDVNVANLVVADAKDSLLVLDPTFEN